MSRQTKFVADQAAAPTIRRRDELVFASLEVSSDSNHDMISTLRTINAYADMPDDIALEGELKNRLAGRMFTLENMANSDYYRRVPNPVKSSGSNELVSHKTGKTGGIYKFTESIKYTDFKDLNEIWNSYAVTFCDLVNSVKQTNCPENLTLLEYKQHLLVTELELIGAGLHVVHSSNSANVGIRGIVVNENENTLEIITEKNKIKKVPKNVCTFKLHTSGDRAFVVFGPDIAGAGRTGSEFRSSSALLRRRRIHSLAYS